MGIDTSSLTWPLVAILACVLGGASFLGYDHVLSGSFVGAIYGAIVSGTAVGHFSTANKS